LEREPAQSPPRRFGPSYGEAVVLADGTRALIRLVRPSDRETLAEGFENLSDESRWLRFHATKPSLSARELSYLTDVDNEDHVALAAATVEGGRGLGIGRFVKVPGTDVAEIALTVIDSAQGKGLGRVLLTRLVEAARERGVARFRFDVLANNAAMRALLADVVPAEDLHVVWDSDSVGHFELELPQPPAFEGVGKQHPLYRLLRLAADGALEFRRNVLARARPRRS
jgi:GNAT superfamily N-acetyltransferase